MFRPSDRQTPLFDAASMISAAQRRRLEDSWAGWFRRTALPILLEMEPAFEALYADGGRPNFSVAQLLGVSLLQHLEVLSDQQALDAYSFDLRWQHALGTTPEQAHTTRRTLVEFRRRLVKTDPEGELLRKVFDRIFEAGAADLKLSTAHQRVDSTLVCSNIRRRGRLSLARETVRLFLRSLDDERLARVSDPIVTWYRQDDEGWEQPREAEQARERLETVGQWALELLELFAEDEQVTTGEPYRLLERLVREHAVTLGLDAATEQSASDDDDDQEPPAPASMSAGQTKEARRKRRNKRKKAKKTGKAKTSRARYWSPYDPDASCGHKGLGYHVEVTETCRNKGPELLTDYDVRTAAEPDTGKAVHVLERLRARDRVPKDLYADAGYPTPEGLVDARKQGTELVAPVHRARMNKDVMSRADFVRDAEGNIVACPRGQAPNRRAPRVSSDTANPQPTEHLFFDASVCRSCPSLPRCPVRTPNNARSNAYRLDISESLVARDLRWSEQRTEPWRAHYRIRGGVEATMSELKRGHGMARLTVRRIERVRIQVAFKTMACNLKRWWRGGPGTGDGRTLLVAALTTVLGAVIALATTRSRAAVRTLAQPSCLAA